MGLGASRKSDFVSDPIPADTYISRCIGVFDLGMQHNVTYDKMEHKAVFQFEIPEVRMEYEKDGVQVNNPRVVSKTFTLSLHKKANLYKALVAWRGKEFTPEELDRFDVFNVLGQPCMLQIINVQGKSTNADRVYSNIEQIGKVYKGLEVPELELEIRQFSFEDIETYEQMMEYKDIVPEWVWGLIEKSSNYRALKERAEVFGTGEDHGMPDDLPDGPPNDDDPDNDLPF